MVKLQSLVEVGFRMATGTVEALRPMGLALQVPCIWPALHLACFPVQQKLRQVR